MGLYPMRPRIPNRQSPIQTAPAANIPGGSLDNLNENDIGSIDVLKDGRSFFLFT